MATVGVKGLKSRLQDQLCLQTIDGCNCVTFWAMTIPSSQVVSSRWSISIELVKQLDVDSCCSDISYVTVTQKTSQ